VTGGTTDREQEAPAKEVVQHDDEGARECRQADDAPQERQLSDRDPRDRPEEEDGSRRVRERLIGERDVDVAGVLKVLQVREAAVEVGEAVVVVAGEGPGRGVVDEPAHDEHGERATDRDPCGDLARFDPRQQRQTEATRRSQSGVFRRQLHASSLPAHTCELDGTNPCGLIFKWRDRATRRTNSLHESGVARHRVTQNRIDSPASMGITATTRRGDGGGNIDTQPSH
jgi:hypothetical protein